MFFKMPSPKCVISFEVGNDGSWTIRTQKETKTVGRVLPPWTIIAGAIVVVVLK